MKKCVIEGCGGASRLRGLCRKCYSSARAKVKSGATTWDALIELGLALPATKRATAFTAALDRLNSQKPAPPDEMDVETMRNKGELADQSANGLFAAQVTNRPERVYTLQAERYAFVGRDKSKPIVTSESE